MSEIFASGGASQLSVKIASRGPRLALRASRDQGALGPFRLALARGTSRCGVRVAGRRQDAAGPGSLCHKQSLELLSLVQYALIVPT